MALLKIRTAFISYLLKHFKPLTIIVFLAAFNFGYGQIVLKEFNKDSLLTYLQGFKSPVNKTIPAEYNEVIRIALLYYPELNDIKIKFRIKNSFSPLAAQPKLFSIFRKASKRKYLVTISSKSGSKLSPILLQNLTTNSQIGVIGHELSHVKDYNKRYGVYFIKLLVMHLSKKSMDHFEYATDMRCIESGLGYQLLSWSTEVRLKLNLMQWKGAADLKGSARERYMNPESILKAMKLNPIYR